MVRNVIGSVLALAGATAAVWSPFRAWYDGRHGRHYRIEDLFAGITDERAEVIGSILLPFAFAALLTLIGLVLRSRLLVAVAGVIVLGFTILWMVRVGQAENGLTVGGERMGLDHGVFYALGGGLLLLLAAAVMSGRHREHAVRVDGHGPPREAGPGDAPVYPHDTGDRGAPTRTMDEPRWDGRGQGENQWDHGRAGDQPYHRDHPDHPDRYDEPPPPQRP
ncbi:hypothetical protein [Streptomyces sp. NPDC093600]|uniref:hypothetical protein n=1 Tax=Streptomyces sp. NPDC093600 TaxID=3366047 RepID=UPI0037F6F605